MKTMNYVSTLNINDSLEQNQLRVKEAYVLKSGFIYLKRKSKSVFDLDRDEYLEEIFENLGSSPFIFKISSKEDIQKSFGIDKTETQIYVCPEHNFISFYESFIEMEILIPERKRSELLSSAYFLNDKPEKFQIFFNGAVFFAVSQLKSFPSESDIGQITRELLTNVLENAQSWNVIRQAPCPIGPDIYFLIVEAENNIDDGVFPKILVQDQNIYILLSPDSNIKESVNNFIASANQAIDVFYEGMICHSNHEDSVNKLNDANGKLSEMLSNYFSINSINRLFSRIPEKIRHTISEQHQLLYTISSIEIEIADFTKRFTSTIDRTPTLLPISGYFYRLLEMRKLFDRNAQLTIMNFAVEETSNHSIIQVTLLSAFIGAVFGGAVSLLVQYLLK